MVFLRFSYGFPQGMNKIPQSSPCPRCWSGATAGMTLPVDHLKFARAQLVGIDISKARVSTCPHGRVKARYFTKKTGALSYGRVSVSWVHVDRVSLGLGFSLISVFARLSVWRVHLKVLKTRIAGQQIPRRVFANPGTSIYEVPENDPERVWDITQWHTTTFIISKRSMFTEI